MNKNNNCAFYNQFSAMESLQHYFEHNNNNDKPYIWIDGIWISDPTTDDVFYEKYVDVYKLHCPTCKSSHDINDLHYENKKLVCKCGARYSKKDINPLSKDMYHISFADKNTHNLNNDTYRKVNVPVLCLNNTVKLYCDKCHTTNSLESLEVKNECRICTCGNKISFNECKIMFEQCYIANAINVFTDNNKISISIVSNFSSINSSGNYYWQNGNYRFTMNLDTGYSYLSTTGHEYSSFNKVYQRYNQGKAPKMINTSYSAMFGLSDKIADAKTSELMYKYKDFPNLIRLLSNKSYEIKKHIKSNIFKKIDDYMTSYYNNKFEYRIKSMQELLKEASGTGVWAQKDEAINYFSLRNRFINASYVDLSDNLIDLLEYSKVYGNNKKKDYKFMPRESNNVILDYICYVTNASKGLRKKLNAQMIKEGRYERHYMGNKFLAFASVARHIKNKELVNNMYKMIIEDEKANEHYYRRARAYQFDIVKFWQNYREDKYLSKLSNEELNKRYLLMQDSLRLINNIKEVLGDDWDISSVPFRTEDQYHEELIRLSNSDLVREAREAKDKERSHRSFKLEDSAIELEETANDILIARNRATLTNIGTAMGICVGSYGEAVESQRCRIAYIKTNGEYIACLELNRRGKTADKKGYKYALTQAKLKYNKHVVENKEIHEKIIAWCERHNIEIDTTDMLNNNGQLCYQE